SCACTCLFFRAWHATHCTGQNCTTVSHTISLRDALPTSIGGQGSNTTIQCPNTPVFSPPTASDSCDASVSVSFSDSSTAGSCAGTGTVTRSWHATECSCITCTTVRQTISSVDSTYPSIGC